MNITYRNAIRVAVLASALLSIAANAAEPVKTILIPEAVPFAEGALVPDNVKNECDLPHEQSRSLADELKDQGFTVLHQDPAAQDASAAVLQIQISTVFSSGNAFIGHAKGVWVSGKLTQGDQQLGSFVAFRQSRGGAFGGFKGSCTVLNRCVKALAEDIAKWAKAPTDKAKLGDAD